MSSSSSQRASAFTLIELLLVIAVIAVLASMLLPALSTAKAKTKRVVCTNHLKQLALAVPMYTADNDGKLPYNEPFNRSTNTWVFGSMKSPQGATNEIPIRLGKLFPYANQIALYRCPADISQTNGAPRVRSYSMNGWIGTRYMTTQSHSLGFRTFVRDSELAAGPSSLIWMFLDEHEASIDDPWFLVTMDDSRPFASFPATRHDHGYNVNFGDGHVEFVKLRDSETERLGSANARITPKNADWLRLKQATTVR